MLKHAISCSIRERYNNNTYIHLLLLILLRYLEFFGPWSIPRVPPCFEWMNIREHLYLSSNRLTLWRAGKDAIRNGEFFEMWVIREIWQVGDDTCVQLASLVLASSKGLWRHGRNGGRNFWPQKSAVFFQCQEIHLSHNEVQQKGESLRFVFFCFWWTKIGTLWTKNV